MAGAPISMMKTQGDALGIWKVFFCGVYHVVSSPHSLRHLLTSSLRSQVLCVSVGSHSEGSSHGQSHVPPTLEVSITLQPTGAPGA